MMTLRRRRGGFTLLEIAVVAVIAGILFILLLRWVGSLMATSAATTDVGSVQRDITYVGQQIENDLEGAQGCDPYGLDGPIRDIDRTRLDLYVPGESGKVGVISWRYDSATDTMQRAEVEGDGTCTFDISEPEWKTVITRVEAPEDGIVFVGHRGGATVQHGSDETMYPLEDGDCAGMQAERCLFDSVEVSYTVRTPGEDRAPFSTSSTYPVNLSGSRLGA